MCKSTQQSVFYGPAWTFNEERNQWYLHQFDASQPDLNFRNDDVIDEMKDVLRFWLQKGASGFRVDAINHMFEVADFADEPLSGYTDDPNSYGYTHHWYTKDLVIRARIFFEDYQNVANCNLMRLSAE